MPTLVQPRPNVPPLRHILTILFLLAALLAAAVSGSPVRAQTPSPAIDFGPVDTTIRDLMALYDVPGVAVGLIKDGKVIYTRGYGVRNTQTQQPVTEDTIFAIGSVSKSFTALDIAQLVDAGKLDLDAPVITYLPDFKLSDPTATRQLTLRHLLSHTSGVPPFDDWYTTPARDRKQIVDDMASVPITALPGKVWQYTNQNFVVAAYVLEQVTGQTWEDYTRQHVFAPLGLTSANFSVADSEKAPDYASPHALDVLKGMQPIPFFRNLGPIGPAGSINANVRDVTRYANFQMGDGTVDGTDATRLVSSRLLTTMHTPQIAIGLPPANPDQPDVQASGQETQTTPTAGTPLPNNLGYGFGWITEDYHGYKVVAHNGAINGFYTYVTLVPAPKDGVVLLTNIEPGNGGETFAEAARLQLVNWLLGVPSEPNLTSAVNKQYGADPAQLKANLQTARTYQADPAALAALTGDYPGVGGVLTVTTRDGKLYAKFEGQSAEAELIPFGPGEFLLNAYPLAGVVIRFQTDAQGTITVYERGAQIAQRLGKGVQLPEYKDPLGRFSVTLPQGLALQQQGDQVLLTSANPPAAFILTALDAGSNPLRINIAQFLRRLAPTFNQDPVSANDIPPINGVVWTQFLYVLPGEQLLAVLATQQNGTTYLMLLQAKQTDLAALTPIFQSLLLGYKIGAVGPTTPAPTPVPGMPRTGQPAEPDLLAAPAVALLASLLLVVGWMLRRRALVRTPR